MINYEICKPEKYNISYECNVVSRKDAVDNVIASEVLYTSYSNKALK